MTSSLIVDASVVSLLEALHQAVSSKGYISPLILEAKDAAAFILTVEDKATAGMLAAYHHTYQLLKDAFPTECEYVLQCCGTDPPKPYFSVKSGGGWGEGWSPVDKLQVNLQQVPKAGKLHVTGDPQALTSGLDSLPEGVAVGEKVFDGGMGYVTYEWGALPTESNLQDVTEPEEVNMPADKEEDPT